MQPIKFKELTTQLRRDVLEYAYRTKSTHIGPSFSIVEVLAALYFEHIKASPERRSDPLRDRFILSKGHACLTLYVILEKLGFITKQTLDGFAKNGGTLEHHPRRNLEMGIELSSGSLGHGLAVGAGIAKGLKMNGLTSKVYVLMSDGEVDEGPTWEATLFAGHHQLDNLVAIIDYNKMQALGNTRDILNLDPLAEKFDAFGWTSHDINGHDHGEITRAFDMPTQKGKPTVIIANTIKGKGVSFMENNLLWHYRTPNDEEYKMAMEELDREL